MSMRACLYIESNTICFPIKLQIGTDKSGNKLYSTYRYNPRNQYWSKCNQIKLKGDKE